MKNIVFNGNDDLFWTYSTPNLTIPNKETLLASKKQQQTLGEDLIIRPSTDGTKSLGFLDSLTNISSKLLSEAEEIETESDEITKELPRIHFIKFDRSTSRLYELYSLDQSNITPYSMMDYNVGTFVPINRLFKPILTRRNKNEFCCSDPSRKLTYSIAPTMKICPFILKLW